jgi:hypothetical protein
VNRGEGALAVGPSVGTLTLDVGEHHAELPLRTTEPIFEPGTFWRLIRLRLDRLLQ